MESSNSTPRDLPKGNENNLSTQRYGCTMMFMAALFVIAPNRKQSKCPSTGKCINHSISLSGKLFICKKEETTDTCNIMDKPKNCYMKEASHKRLHILLVHFYKMSIKGKFIHRESISVVA